MTAKTRPTFHQIARKYGVTTARNWASFRTTIPGGHVRADRLALAQAIRSTRIFRHLVTQARTMNRLTLATYFRAHGFEVTVGQDSTYEQGGDSFAYFPKNDMGEPSPLLLHANAAGIYVAHDVSGIEQAEEYITRILAGDIPAGGETY